MDVSLAIGAMAHDIQRMGHGAERKLIGELGDHPGRGSLEGY